MDRKIRNEWATILNLTPDVYVPFPGSLLCEVIGSERRYNPAGMLCQMAYMAGKLTCKLITISVSEIPRYQPRSGITEIEVIAYGQEGAFADFPEEVVEWAGFASSAPSVWGVNLWGWFEGEITFGEFADHLMTASPRRIR